MSQNLFYFLFVLLALSKNLPAASDHPLARAEAVITTSPSSLINNSVNAIEGSFCFSSHALQVPGKEPLHVSHHYNSKSRYASWLGTGLSLNYSFWIVGKWATETSKYSHINAEGAYGSVISCLAEYEEEGNSYYLDPEIIYGGLTNCGSGELSGRTNFKNSYIKEQINSHGLTSWTSYLPDGTVREYHRTHERDEAKNVKHELRPNKSLLEYIYNSDRSPKKIVAKRHNTLNWLEFTKKHHEATISTSNGKEVTYTYVTKDGAQYVKEINSSDIPTEEFEYTKVDGHYCINRISWPKGRFLEVEYDDKGRVISQKAPVGKNGEKRTIFHFSYHPNDGYTKVFDAYDRKKIYRHRHKRLTAIEQYKKNNSLYRINAFYWGKRKDLSRGKPLKTNEGNLLGEALLDHDKKAHYARHFTYDVYGNVLKETVYGNLSGKGKKRFTLSSNGQPQQSVEHYSRHYRYSKDRFHLKVLESEPDGPTIKYSYKKDSNICYAKFICNKNKILIREFYSYDKNGAMIQKIIDDGSDTNRSKLTNVTQRLITKIKPVRQKEGYGQGLPSIISEYYLNLKTNREILLNRTIYGYNRQSQVTKEKIFDASNNYRYTLYTEYDQKGRVHKKNNEQNEWITYTYDENDNKISERAHGAGFEIKYTYDKANRCLSETEQHDQEINISCSYDLVGNKKSSTDRYGNKTHYEYDDCNRLKKVVLPELENGHRYTIQKKWDIFDNLLSETNQNGATTTFEYTARKQPLRTIYPDGGEETYEYNLNGSLKAKWDQSGTRTSYTYDILGRVITTSLFDSSNNKLSTTKNSYNAFHLLSSTDPMGITTYYSYDQAGRKIEEWTATETNYNKTTLEYDPLGRVSCTKHFYDTGYISTYTEYDFLNRVILEKQVDMAGLCTSWTYYEYDRLGNCTLKRWGLDEGQQAEVAMLYNSKSELTKITDEHNNQTHLLINHNFRNGFNKQSPRKISTDPLGTSTEEYFDTLGRLISVLKKNRESKLIAITDFEYNGTGKKIKQIEKIIIDGVIDHDYVITWELDSLDRVTKQTEQPGAFEEKATHYAYDKSGRLSTLTKPDGVVLSHTYDALGRLICLHSSDNTIYYTYSYDLHNNPIEISDEIRGFVTERSYDAWNRVLSDGIQNSVTQTFNYDALGRLTSLTAPDGSSVEYTYDETYLKAIKRGSYIHTYDQFNLKGQVLQSTLIGRAGTLTLAYDKKDRNTHIASTHFTQEIPSDGFDAVGNLKKYTLIDPIGELQGEADYDELHQLIEEKGVQDHVYKNDSLSNRIKKDSQEYFIDEINRLITDSSQEYVYDKNGNIIEKKYEGKTIYYTYDALDRLVEVADGSRVTIYVYDYLHRRIVRTVNREDPEYFLYLDCREIGLFNPKTATLNEYRVLGLGKGAELGANIAIELGENIYSPIHDYRGNIVCLIDYATGEVEESYRYTGYGECEIYNKDKELVENSSIGNCWGFSSKRIDPETGFIYFHRRYYFPEIGRWITPDPLGFADGPNLYAYVHNSPFTHFDLYGLEAVEIGRMNQLEGASEYKNETSGYSVMDHEDNQIRSSKGWISSFRSTCNDIWDTTKENAPKIAYDALDALDKASTVAMFVPEPEICLSGIVFKGISMSGKTILKVLRSLNGSKIIKSTRRIFSSNSLINSSGAKTVSVAKIFKHQELPSLDLLSKAGQVLDREGLTRAGRALDKHGNRSGSVFPKAIGNPSAKNMQGQAQLDEILTHPKRRILRDENNGYEIYVPDGRGAYFREDGSFRGFIEDQLK